MGIFGLKWVFWMKKASFHFRFDIYDYKMGIFDRKIVIFGYKLSIFYCKSSHVRKNTTRFPTPTF